MWSHIGLGFIVWSISNVHVEDPVFSDHMPVLCDNLPLNSIVKQAAPVRCYRAFVSDSAERFSLLYYQVMPYPPFLSTLDDLLSYFDSACKCVLDVVAPLRLRQCPRLVPSPQS